MVLYFVGLGLADEKDITVKGLEAVRSSDRIYLEAYTSQLLVPCETLEAFYEKPVIVATREMVESEADSILDGADTGNVSFLVVGDPYGATTHTDLELRARERDIPVEVVHNASVMNAVGAVGLQLYRYGECLSIVFFTQSWQPDSFYDRLVSNRAAGLHTLCLLDIKVREPTMESLARGRPVYAPPRFMTAARAARQLLQTERRRQGGVAGPDALAVAVARLGARDQKIVAGTLSQLAEVDMGPPLHSLVVVGDCHHIEEEALGRYMLPQDAPTGGQDDEDWEDGA